MPSESARTSAGKIMGRAEEFVKASNDSPFYAAQIVTDVADDIDAHTAEALAEHQRALDEAIEALTEISKRVPDYGHEGVGTVARYALDAITKLKGKQG